MKRTVVLDAEFNGLEPDKLWCIVCKDIANGISTNFRLDRPQDWSNFNHYASSVSCWVGHNIISFDCKWINLLLDREVIDWRKCIDTLIVSRLINFNKPGGHSVENWAKQFGLTKKFIDDWENLSIDEYVERCKYDVEIQYRIYKELERFIKDPSWKKAMRVEHDLQYICRDMHENGFAFDKDKAEVLLSQIKDEMAELEEQIRQDIPPVLVQDGPVKLKVNKNGGISKRTLDAVGSDCSVSPDSEFHRCHWEPFNPGSSKQRINYLNSVGWKPVDKTKGHLTCERQYRAVQRKYNQAPNWKKPLLKKELDSLAERLEQFRITGWRVSEQNLETLPNTALCAMGILDGSRNTEKQRVYTSRILAAKQLAKWLTLEGRRGDLEEWISCYVPSSGRIHGSFNGLGSWTHRMSHVRPNQGNIFSNFTTDECKGDEPTPVEEVKLNYNGALRALWTAGRGKLLVGTDAEGIQMRVLAHYINDPEYTEAIVNGDKEQGTDVHNLNRRKLGSVCRSRADAKTFIYAWLLGAGTAKVAEILGCNFVQARAAVESFIRDTPGLAELKRHRIPRDARRGYFVGLDGRKVICRSEHLMLAGYLQNGEKVVMAHANVLWRQRAQEMGLQYKQVDFVHDEWVTEVGDMETAHALGELQAQAIQEVGEDLGLNCALAGEYKIGGTWLDVH